MTGKRHDIVYRIAPFVEIGNTASAGSMERNHFPFGLSFNKDASSTMLFVFDRLIDTASFG